MPKATHKPNATPKPKLVQAQSANSAHVNKMLNAEEKKKYSRVTAITGTLMGHVSGDANVPNATVSGPMNGLCPKANFEINVDPTEAQAEFTVVVFPRLYRPIFTTDFKAAPTTLYTTIILDPVQGYPYSKSQPPGLHEIGVPICLQGTATMQGDWWGRCKESRAFSYYENGKWWVPYDYGQAQGAELTVEVSARAALTAYFKLQDGSVVSQIFTPTSDLEDQWTSVYTVGTLKVSAVSIEVTPLLAQQTISISISPTSGFTTGSRSILHAYDTDIFEDISTVAERVTCLSSTLLASFRGSTLENGGTIAGDQLVSGFKYSPQRDSRYDELARIPRAYNGPLKDGCFVFWVPENFIKSQLVNPFATHHNECLVVSGTVDDPTQRIIVTVCQEFRFTVLSRLYAHNFYEIDLEAWILAIMSLQGMPNAYCNPDHLARVRRAMQHLWKHREDIGRGLKMAATAVKTVAPVLAMI